MRASYRVTVFVIGLALLALAVYYVPSSGMGISSSSSPASKQFWDTAPWGISYKLGAIVAVLVCLAIRYISRVPPIRGE